MDKKTKKKIDVLKQRLGKRRQLLAAARQQMDDPTEVKQLEDEITAIERELDELRDS
ncbi:MAG: hypothetical protein R3C10_12205 [Pirellulales bacterium]|nr:hypothetical protein [Planctomycetales bacterium]